MANNCKHLCMATWVHIVAAIECEGVVYKWPLLKQLLVLCEAA